uniref:non-specific serine/threonine protein kinase n=1 Tax=viral metagenome TaxID=1070528 RepID=A0A6C0JL41_9ZZZZ
MNGKKVLNKKYNFLEKIGHGNFGSVYKGINQKNGEHVAIKSENRNSPIKLLKNETSILKYLYDYGSRITPIVYWFGVDNEFNYLIMSYYEISLYDYCNQNSLSIDKINKIMYASIDILETIHKNYIIHCDIKPQNFMISNEELFLIDFGFSRFFIDENKKPLCDLGSQNIIGTPKYVSYNIHNGNMPSCRDDLISLGYIYLYLCCRELPWDNLKINNTTFEYDDLHILNFKNQQRKNLKEWENLEKLCLQVNEKIHKFLNYCYLLKYDSTPEYTILKTLFT